MLLREIVDTSAAVAATRSRTAKVAAIASLLARAAPAEREIVATYLGGAVRQRRTGVGWRSLSAPPPPAATAGLEVAEVDAAIEELAALAGGGSQAARAAGLADLLGRASAEEQRWLRGALTGELRQGAQDSLVQEAVAVAAEVPLPVVRRAAMLAGSTRTIVDRAFRGEAALAEVGLEVGRPVLPMLASSATTVTDAVTDALARGGEAAVAVDVKLDGIRIQVHRRPSSNGDGDGVGDGDGDADGGEVRVVTRSLDDITERLPDVVAVARALPASSFVLDGEALGVGADGRPRPFQETASRGATRAGSEPTTEGPGLAPYFFDVLHLDGRDLLDAPAAERWAALEALVPPEHRVERLVTADATEAETFAARAVEAGHEGVVVKDLAAPYAAGRRGAAWVKVKPVHTLDLVVLAVEWGSGRRTGKLSNLHLAARDPAHAGEPGGFVMLGKTFKGMTDEMLSWQTERFLSLETRRTTRTVYVAPVQVVEIAFDGVQRSTRYPGGVALRFARVVGYRDDKSADEADTLASVRSYLPAAGAATAPTA